MDALVPDVSNLISNDQLTAYTYSKAQVDTMVAGAGGNVDLSSYVQLT